MILTKTFADNGSAPLWLEHLFRKYHGDMLRFANHRLRLNGRRISGFDADDVVQEAFLRIARYGRELDVNDGKRTKVYLFTVVSNVITDFYSKADENLSYEELTEAKELCDDESFVAELNINERCREVMKAISELDEKYKIVFYYRFSRNMKLSEIADLLNIPENTVKIRIMRGRALLIKKLNGSDLK